MKSKLEKIKEIREEVRDFDEGGHFIGYTFTMMTVELI